MNINHIRNHIPWIKNNKNKIYLDKGATTLKPKCVIDKISYYYSFLGINIHNIDSKFSFEFNKKIEMARKNIAKVINCSPENICFVGGAIEGLTMVAHGSAHYFKKAEILLNIFEHESNLLPWYHEKQNGFFTIKFVNMNKKFNEEATIEAITKNTIIIVLDATQYLVHKWIEQLKNRLGTKGIIFCSGLSCAKLVKNVFKKDSFVRCSLSIYDTKKEIDSLYSVIKSYKKGDELKKIL